LTSSLQFISLFLRPDEAAAIKVIKNAAKLFRAESNVLHLEGLVTICGDVHGQFYDLVKLLEVGGCPEATQYLFLGDYVDRGPFGVECILLLWALKICHPETFFLLRGNHECREITEAYDFKKECEAKYSLLFYEACMEAFDCLPLAAVVDRDILCVHGGLSPGLRSLGDLDKLDRFQEPLLGSPMNDVLWSDPRRNFGQEEGGEAAFMPNADRGEGCLTFSYEAACLFLRENGLRSIVRGHQFELAGFRQHKTYLDLPSVVTVFSAPNYSDVGCNKAAIVKYSDADFTFRQFTPSTHPLRLPEGPRPRRHRRPPLRLIDELNAQRKVDDRSKNPKCGQC
jgi:serine/threonine-protein phosphatase 2B catalytic subunit